MNTKGHELDGARVWAQPHPQQCDVRQTRLTCQDTQAGRRCCGWSFGHSRAPGEWRRNRVRQVVTVLLLLICTSAPLRETIAAEPLQWQAVETTGKPHPRHEAAFVECDGRFLLLGGRGIKPVDIFDPATSTWTHGAPPPVEVHHFQPVVWEGRVLLAGAMTGKYPRETALDRILIYDPKADAWSWGAEIPADRRRGGAGAAIRDGKLYLVCGIQNGHWDGWVKWLDALDLRTGQWSKLPAAPRVRDHFMAAWVGDKLYAAGGRKSSGATKEVFNLTIAEVDVFDAGTGRWSTLPAPGGNLPTPRAGCCAFVLGHDLLIGGGETAEQKTAHSEVEALDTRSGVWRAFATLARGRHGTGMVQWRNTLYTCSGSGGRGGGPELDTTEMLPLPKAD